MKIDDFILAMKQSFLENKDFVMPINGTSMEPFLHKNDLVVLRNCNDIKKNDIVLYKRNNGQYVLHRIFSIKKEYYVLLGDHQTIKEYPIYKEQIIAKVVGVKKENKDVNLNSFKYKLYLLFFRFMIIRRINNKIRG